MPPHLQNLVALLSEVEESLTEMNVARDQHSRALHARALAALRSAQQETALWGEWVAAQREG
jgi:hypothetical protein